MKAVTIEVSLLREMLNAASRSAFTHYGSEHESFVLGQLDATANFAYVLASGADDPEFELYCQQLALEAIDRYSELASTQHAQADGIEESEKVTYSA